MFFRCRAFFVYNFFAVCYNFLLRHINFIIENEEELQMEKKKKFQMPHTYIIIFGVILFAAILTMFIPLGKYETKEITYTMNGEEKTRTVLDPDSFEYVLDENGNKVTKVAPLFGTEDFGGQGILNYVFEGMTTGNKNGTAVGIIAFILVVGGSFGIVLRTGAVESGIMRVISMTNGKEILLVPILTVLFSLGGAVFGMGEEAIPFVMILVPMLIAMGYDAVVGIMCSYVATLLAEPVRPGCGSGYCRNPGYVRCLVPYPVMDHLYRPDLCVHHALCSKGKEEPEDFRCL